MRATQSEFRRGWRMLTAGTIGEACGLAPIPLYAMGAFAIPMTQYFGWSRAGFQGAILVLAAVQLVMAPIVGVIMDRHGYRRLALVSYAAFACALVMLGLLANSLASFYGLIVLVSICGAGTIPLMWSRAVLGWFDRRAGIALGIIFSGTGIFSSLGPSYATWLIESFGWRWAFVGLGLLPGVIALPIAYIFLREPVEDIRRNVDPVQPVPIGLTFGEAVRTRQFWALIAAVLFVSLGIGGLGTHMIPLMIDRGVTPQAAAFTAGAYGIALIIGRVIAGSLADYLWAPLIGFVMLSAPLISCFILLSPGSFLMLTTAVAIVGFAAGADVSLMSFMTNRYFGKRAYGALAGWMFAAYSLGLGGGSLIFGAVFDRDQSYVAAITLAMGGFLIGPLLLLLMGRYPTLSKQPVGT